MELLQALVNSPSSVVEMELLFPGVFVAQPTAWYQHSFRYPLRSPTLIHLLTFPMSLWVSGSLSGFLSHFFLIHLTTVPLSCFLEPWPLKNILREAMNQHILDSLMVSIICPSSWLVLCTKEGQVTQTLYWFLRSNWNHGHYLCPQPSNYYRGAPIFSQTGPLQWLWTCLNKRERWKSFKL